MSQSSSLLAGGEDVVCLNSAWSLLSTGCDNSTIVDLVSDVLSLYGAQGCTIEMCCGIADSTVAQLWLSRKPSTHLHH